MPTLSVITTFHREGNIACQTIGSLAKCLSTAMGSGIDCEWLAVLDRTDPVTRGIVERGAHDLPCGSRVVDVDLGDVGLSRNVGVGVASGHVLAITDGDDYFSRHWLVRAVEACQQRPEAVVTPQFALSFGVLENFYEQISSEDAQFEPGMLLTVNPWLACVVGHRVIFQNIPYPEKKNTGFIYEDWQWNCETIAHGHPRIPVPDTAVFYRRRSDGTLAFERAKQGTFGPTSLFRRQSA